LAELADASECVAADGSDEVEGADCSGEADESEPQAASRTRANSAPAISRTPIPFLMMIASFVLRSVSNASLKAGKSPYGRKNAYAGTQADLQPAHGLLPREAAALVLLGGSLVTGRVGLGLLLAPCPLCCRLLRVFLF
jgi:hypothetical protein